MQRTSDEEQAKISIDRILRGAQAQTTSVSQHINRNERIIDNLFSYHHCEFTHRIQHIVELSGYCFAKLRVFRGVNILIA